jgi:predicted phage-related endonuclease
MNGLGVSSDQAYLLPHDAAAVLGLDQSRTPFEVWLQKKGKEVLVGGAPFFSRVLEPLISEFYERDHSCDLSDTSDRIFVHPSLPFIAAQPCWLVTGQRVGVEILSIPSRLEDDWGKNRSQDVPEKWRLRAILNMAVLDHDRWDLAVSIDHEYPRYYSIARNVQHEQLVLESLKRWWETYILGDCEPDPGGSALAVRYLQSRLPSLLAPPRIADQDMEKAGAELSAILAHIAAFEKRRFSLENLLKLKMGAAGAVVGEFGKATWKQAELETAVDWQRLAEALLIAHYPGRERELVAAFSTIRTTERVFHFLPRGQKELVPS